MYFKRRLLLAAQPVLYCGGPSRGAFPRRRGARGAGLEAPGTFAPGHGEPGFSVTRIHQGRPLWGLEFLAVFYLVQSHGCRKSVFGKKV